MIAEQRRRVAVPQAGDEQHVDVGGVGLQVDLRGQAGGHGLVEVLPPATLAGVAVGQVGQKPRAVHRQGGQQLRGATGARDPHLQVGGEPLDPRKRRVGAQILGGRPVHPHRAVLPRPHEGPGQVDGPGPPDACHQLGPRQR